jgi:hypothetical protein
MRKILLLLFAMTLGFGLNAQIYYNDFDGYNSGDYLAKVDTEWTTWTNAPGSAEDPVISDAFSSTAPNAVMVSGTNDGVFPCGDLTSGAYVIAFDMYVPTDRVGYFNIQQVFASEWGMSLTFMPDASITVSCGGEAPTGFTFPQDTWFPIEVMIDLNADWASCYVDDELITEWQWSLTEDGTPGTLQLGCVNTYAYDGGVSGTPEYYFDNFTFDEMATVLYFEDFDDFSDGDYLAVVDPENWTTWTNAPGTAEDAVISSAQSETAPNAVMVSGTNDAVFPCGDLTSGSYAIDFDFYVPSGNAGYYNLQHVFASEWAIEVFFNADLTTSISAGGQLIENLTYTPDEWFHVTVEIDMGDDWATMYWDDEMVLEFQWSLDTDGNPGTNQLGCVNMYAGANGSDVPLYYFDNFMFTATSSALAPPTVELSETEFLVEISDGVAVTETFTVGNIGEQDLTYEIYPVYDIDEVTGTATATVAHCGDFNGGVGFTAATAVENAVLLTPSLMEEYIGTELTAIEFYIDDTALDFEIKVWAQGATTVPGPGEEIYASAFTPTIGAWSTAELDEPIILDGTPIWIGVAYFQPAGLFTMGCDIGPQVPGVNFRKTGPAWAELSLDYNYNVRGIVTGDPITTYMDIPVNAGMVLPGSDETVGVFFDPSGLDAGTYTGMIAVATNDPETNYSYIDVTLDIITATNDINQVDALTVYPNPTADLVHLRADANITEVRVSNYLGQVVNVYQMNETQSNVDLSTYDDGVYFVEVTTTVGTHTVKVVKK